MLEKKHLVFLAGATAPFAPPLCTALDEINLKFCQLSPDVYSFNENLTDL